MLHHSIAANRREIIGRWRAKAASRFLAPSADTRSDHGVPLFLDQLSETLRLELQTSPEIASAALRHGIDLLHRGFTVSQVVHDYGDVCQAITELAVEMNVPISTADFHTLNRCLDEAIASAVTEYGRERHRSDVDEASARGTERLGFFAHELRNLLSTAIMAFQVLKSGNVGVTGSTGTVLHRSLVASHALIGRSLAQIRLTQGIQHRERFLVAEFIEGIALASTLEANARGVTLIVAPILDGVTVDADRQVLGAVVGNLLQNAFKFTRARTTVNLKVVPSADRVLIEVEDECGGLAGGDTNELFRPFEQRSPDRTGVGLGLAFSRWGVEANEGRISAHNLPGKGCVFTIDLPRCPGPVLEAVPS